MAHSLGFEINAFADSGQLIDATVTDTDNDYDVYDGTVGATSTNVLCNIAFPYANVKKLLLYSDKALTLFTNATDGTGGNPFTLTAGVPVIWYTGCGYTNPLTHDVTKFYANNAGSAAARLVIAALYH